jgi:hypothetical protein
MNKFDQQVLHERNQEIDGKIDILQKVVLQHLEDDLLLILR